jgi:hypothetical protein
MVRRRLGSERLVTASFVQLRLGSPTDAEERRQLHYQPTRESVRRAEENARLRFVPILARAKILNAGGKTTDCMQSVTEAKRMLGLS